MALPEELSKTRTRCSVSDTLMAIMESLTAQKRQLARDNEADVVLQFGESYIIVSARMMSQSSQVFKKWLDSISGDRAPRSATKPQWFEMSSDVSAVHMKFLCALLHGHRLRSDYPGTDEPAALSLLGDLAVVVKKFHAVSYLSDTISPNLLQPFAKRLSRSVRDDEQRSFNRDAQLAKIAYLLEQEAMFSVFTRRMILDHCISLSQLEPSVAKALEPLLLLKLEEKRAEAIIIDFKIHQTATRTCRYCPITTYIPSIIAAIGNNLSPALTVWPPRYDKYSLRQVLVAIHSLGKSRATEGSDFQFCPYHRNLPIEVNTDFREVALEMSRLMLGAYYSCKAVGGPHHSDCEHLESTRDLVERLDPLG
ncbi:hypothetical protein MBLNU13_g07379t1 [Cladosporium sp. NU13]